MTGSGTEGDPYIITSAADLQNVANDLAAYYELGANIDLSEVEWTPLGSIFGTLFTGHFDGKGYTISNLTISSGSGNGDGLFGATDGATITDVHLVDVSIDATGEDYIGALVGYAYKASIISNCSSTGSVAGDDGVGGLIGVATISGEDYPTISQCYSECIVTGGGSADQHGGLIGWTEGAVVQNCYAIGSVSGYRYVGGLIGEIFSGSDIQNCYSIGAIAGTNYYGGLIGLAQEGSTVTGCYWDVETSGQNESDGGTGKTTAEMKLQSTYTDWDFTTIWGMLSSYNDGYPNLDDQRASVTTVAASGTSYDLATLNGTHVGVALVFFQWDFTMDLAYWTIPAAANGSFSKQITGLPPNTTVYFRAVGIDVYENVVYGDVLSFTTTAVTPRTSSYTEVVLSPRGKPIFLAECKAWTYNGGLIETQYSDNGIATFSQIPTDTPVYIESKWGRHGYQRTDNIFCSSSADIVTLVTQSHIQNTDDYVKGVPTAQPGTPSTGMVYCG